MRHGIYLRNKGDRNERGGGAVMETGNCEHGLPLLGVLFARGIKDIPAIGMAHASCLYNRILRDRNHS